MSNLDLIASSFRFRAVLDKMDIVTRVNSAALIQGETGTGAVVQTMECFRRTDDGLLFLNEAGGLRIELQPKRVRCRRLPHPHHFRHHLRR